MHVKLEVRTGPLRTDTQTQTDTQTRIERKQYLDRSLRSLGEDNHYSHYPELIRSVGYR